MNCYGGCTLGRYSLKTVLLAVRSGGFEKAGRPPPYRRTYRLYKFVKRNILRSASHTNPVQICADEATEANLIGKMKAFHVLDKLQRDHICIGHRYHKAICEPDDKSENYDDHFRAEVQE